MINCDLVPLSIAAETPAFPRAETSLAQKHIEPFPLKRFHSRVSARGKNFDTISEFPLVNVKRARFFVSIN